MKNIGMLLRGEQNIPQQKSKRLIKKHYGWKPRPNDPDLKVQDGAAAKVPPSAAATVTPPPTRYGQKLQARQPVGREYSFEFLSKHKCQPNGWTYKKPRRNKATLVNYYYLCPGFTFDKLGVEGQDHFLSHYDVLDWCHRNGYYPSPGGAWRAFIGKVKSSLQAKNGVSLPRRRLEPWNLLSPSGIQLHQAVAGEKMRQTRRRQHSPPRGDARRKSPLQIGVLGTKM